MGPTSHSLWRLWRGVDHPSIYAERKSLPGLSGTIQSRMPQPLSSLFRGPAGPLSLSDGVVRRGVLVSKRANIVSRKKIHIEWGDCDPAQIVYFPRYFAYFDACTTALFK